MKLLIQTNKSFLKFNLQNTKGEEIDITAFLGKVKLVDFWASRCGPCRIRHPDLIKLKKKFEKRNFDIVSISIDDNKGNWIKAIEKDRLESTNLLDVKKEITNKLGIHAIPYNYLLDEYGVILGINLKIEEIENVLVKKAN